MTLESVNENGTAYLTVAFYDKNNNAVAPASISYYIKTEAGDSVRGVTPIDAASSIEITLDTNDNEIQNSNGASEIHVVTVVGTYSATDKVVGVYKYQVVRVDAI